MRPETLEYIKSALNDAVGFRAYYPKFMDVVWELVEAYEELAQDKGSKSPSQKTVCVDLDGVLAQYDGWKGVEYIGEPIQGAVEFIKDLVGTGCQVLIHTTRCTAKVNPYPRSFLEGMVRSWMRKHHFPRCDIYTGQGKPLAAAYVDDRAVVCKPQECLSYYQIAFGEVCGLLRTEK